MKLQRRNFRAMMFLHYSKGKSAADSHEILYRLFQDLSPSYSTVKFWFGEFRRGKEDLEDDQRTSRPNASILAENIEVIEAMLNSDKRVTPKEIEGTLSIGSGNVKWILQNHMHLKQHSCCWIPQTLNEMQKQARVEWCHYMLKKFENGGSPKVWDIVVEDQIWLYQYEPETKRQASVWVFPDEDPPLKLKRPRSVGKTMMATYFQRSGYLVTTSLTDREIVSAQWYVTKCLPQLFEAIKLKRPDSGLRGILLHHDDTRINTAAATLDLLAENHVQIISHPDSSPDLSPCDYFLFSKVKEKLRGIRFESPEEAVQALVNQMSQLSNFEWTQCFSNWFKRMKTCIDCEGDYFEKT
ncbi:histone-lysine N-methyltransferase SETMAR-like [Octopus bimaculoides]|uniref:histone-lysine N-methyltransferase SETMAR-like n=1 Tax=Octopus bimaculoides TaxID=37653 RepID=UPI00071D25B0|nr:histone-lysine N-methyltransferase SETMAR-like [Octopus bimaculoides]|eukprot:XP_014783185.1 PREDICTED: histone-lysine N-methyltransferase SETMAR-like [Octopus bimaculoides]